eukprot:6538618-Alexandrium_andersonii.AAC.1
MCESAQPRTNAAFVCVSSIYVRERTASQEHHETCTLAPTYVLSRSGPKATPPDTVNVSADQRGLSRTSISQHT